MIERVIAITGTTGKIGDVLFDEVFSHTGTNVASLSRSNEDSMTNKILMMQGNVNFNCDVNLFTQRILEKWGRIDILINNAGTMLMKPIEQYTVEDYYKIFEVNVKGAFLLSKEVLPIMKKQEQGYIINIGSTRAITAAPDKSLYCMSKFALRALTQSINIEYNKYGVYSTIICPGAVDVNRNCPEKVQLEDISKTVKYLLSLSKNLRVPEIILGGQL